MRIVFFFQRRRYGRELEPVQLWGRIPQAYLGMAVMNHALNSRTSQIEPALRSLIQVLISRINSCAFCIDLNSQLSLERGATIEKVRSVTSFDASPLFTEQEKAALSYAREVTQGAREISANTLQRLREHFDDQAIVELAALIAFQNMSSKFNSALGIAAHGFCDMSLR